MQDFDLNLGGNANVAKDLLPTKKSERNWGIYSYFATWIGMDIGIPTYYLASSLIVGGMDLKWAMFTILLANVIIAFPILANGHAGAKYGIPSTIYWRSAFGFNGASVAAILRGVVAAGWCGIQFWIGGSALNTVLGLLFPAWAAWPLGKWVCFGVFLVLNIFILIKGMGVIQKMEHWCAPLLIIWLVVLLVWARTSAGEWGPLIRQQNTFASTTEFLTFFIIGLNSNISYWGSMPLTVTDLTKVAKDQKSQMVGQFIGVPTGIVGLALVGSLVTSCTVVMFGEAIWDPVQLTGMIENVPLVIGMMAFLIIATLTTNIAANALTPATAIVHLTGGKINFKWAAVILGIVGVLIRPWVLVSDMGVYMNFFLNGGGALLGPIIGITICHYFFICRTELNLRSLYVPEDESKYTNLKKFNMPTYVLCFAAAVALVVLSFVLPASWTQAICTLGCTHQFSMIAMGVIIALLGLLVFLNRKGGVNPISILTIAVSFIIIFLGLWVPALHWLYDASIIVGTLVAMLVYYLMMKAGDSSYMAAKKAEHAALKAEAAKAAPKEA